MSIDRYNDINKNGNEFRLPNIKAFIPSPKKLDYDSGYIVRYFVQKSNDISAPIYEISKNSFNKASDTSFYSVVALDWRITGDPIEVKKSNSASVRIASEIIPKIQLYLPNLLQFHQK